MVGRQQCLGRYVKHFLAEELCVDGHWYAVDFYAEDWGHAEAICLQEGWMIKGEIHAKIPASPIFGEEDANRVITNLNSEGGKE